MSKIKVNEIEKASGSGIIVPIGSTFTITDGLAQASIADQAINEAKLQISNAPTNGYFLSAQSGNTGGLTWAEAGGGGKVLQAVTGTSSTATTTTSTSFVDTGLNVAITPSATSSKILVMAHTTGVADTSGQFSYFTIERQISGGSDTNIGDSSIGLAHMRGDAVNISPTSLHALDSPSTTSAVTYEFQFRTSGSGNTAQCMYQGVKGNITVLEIGA